MTLENNHNQPYRPPFVRGNNHYRIIKRELTARPVEEITSLVPAPAPATAQTVLPSTPSLKSIPEISQPNPQPSHDLFSMIITAAITTTPNIATDTKETTMDAQFIVNLVFKPFDPKLRLRPEERQLLLAHIGEILKELEIEEQKMISEENQPAAMPTPPPPEHLSGQENRPCT